MGGARSQSFSRTTDPFMREVNDRSNGSTALILSTDIKIRAAQLNAQDVQIGDALTLQEVRLTADSLIVNPAPRASIRVQEATVTLVATEKSLNSLLHTNPPDGTRDLSLATLTGRVRIEGKFLWNRIPVPFTLTAVPEIEGGARLRLNVHEIRAFGPLPIPSVITQGIANRINDTLAKWFDITKLPIQVRLTGLTVEPGRILLSATAAIDVTPVLTRSEAIDKSPTESQASGAA